MSRPLKVTRLQAIEAAMLVFWSKGYSSTSVDDLQNAIGIQRGSFYFHFKDKRALFLEVLDHYKVLVVDKRRALVRAESSPVRGIRLFFELLLEHNLAGKLNAGCLNTNTATEIGLKDEDITEKIGLGLNGWKEFWIEILNNAIEKNEISNQTDVVSCAQLLVGLTQGINVVARVNPDRDFLNGIVSAGLSFLEKKS